MAADLARAQRLEGGEARPWVETGQMLAELGKPAQADAASARPSALGQGELNPIPGSRVVGGRAVPGANGSGVPAGDRDRPVTASRRGGRQTRPAVEDHSGGRTRRQRAGGSSIRRARPGVVLRDGFRPRRREPDGRAVPPDCGRCPVVGQRPAGVRGVQRLGIAKHENTRVPVTLRAGRNRLLLKVEPHQSSRLVQGPLPRFAQPPGSGPVRSRALERGRRRACPGGPTRTRTTRGGPISACDPCSPRDATASTAGVSPK